MSDSNGTAGRPEPRGGVGSLDELLERLNKEKKAGRMMGPNEQGEENYDFPSFFSRTGVRLYEIDTGLGIVKCRTPRVTIENKTGNPEDIPESQLIPFIVRSLVELPGDWLSEESFAFKDLPKVVAEQGKPLPSPSLFYDAPLAAQQEYLLCLPKSLGTQVFIATGYMALPPLPARPQTPRS